MMRSYNIDADSDSLIHLVAPTTRIEDKMLYVQDIGFFVARENFYMRRHALHSYLIQYTIEGEGYLEYENQAGYLPADTIMWIDCRNPQFYRTSSRTKYWKTIWVHLYGANCQYYYEQFLATNGGKNMARHSLSNHVPDFIHQCIELYQNFDCDLNTDIHASALLANILSECITLLSGSERTMPAHVQKARSYIRSHYTESITLELLAGELFISKYHLQRLFRQYMQMSPKEYLCQLRINHAKQALRTTNLSVREIAAEVGYNNVSHFIHLFQKYERQTPGSYRTSWSRLSY